MNTIRKNISLLALLAIVHHICAQDTTYFKVNLHEESRNSRQIIEYENRYFVLNTGVCDFTTECSSFMEIDLAGNIIWEKELRWLDVAAKAMTIHGDTVSIVGNTVDNVGFYLHQMSIEGDSITTYMIEDPNDTYDRMFQIINIMHNGQHLIGGTGRKNNENFALIYVINSDGSLDTLISPARTNERATIWDMYIDAVGLLTVFIYLDTDESPDYRMIVKYDDDFNIVWSYTTEAWITGGVSIPRGCELQDGRTAFVFDIDNINAYMSSVRAINHDSTVSWWYQWPDFSGGDARTIHNLKTLSNGDIIGLGSYADYTNDPRITNSPFIFRLSSEGEMLWQRIFIEQHPFVSDRTIYGFLYDMKELADGALLAVGGWRSRGDAHGDPIIVLMDAEGCILFDCGELIPTPTREIVAVFNGQINIFPNPISNDVLNIDIQPAEGFFDDFNLKIYDFQGHLLQQSSIRIGHNQVGFSNYHKGIYLFVIEKNGLVITSKKMVK